MQQQILIIYLLFILKIAQIKLGCFEVIAEIM